MTNNNNGLQQQLTNQQVISNDNDLQSLQTTVAQDGDIPLVGEHS